MFQLLARIGSAVTEDKGVVQTAVKPQVATAVVVTATLRLRAVIRAWLVLAAVAVAVATFTMVATLAAVMAALVLCRLPTPAPSAGRAGHTHMRGAGRSTPSIRLGRLQHEQVRES